MHNDIITLIEILAQFRQRSPHTIGRIVASNGDFYKLLKDGHDITIRRAERVVQQLSIIWPADLEWPSDIQRPELSTTYSQAELTG